MIRRLTEADTDALLAIRHEALVSCPTAFTSSPDTDVGHSPEFIRRVLRTPSAQGIFGAFDADLVGMVGVYREQKLKQAHKAGVWGMYVRPAYRRRGLGAALMAAAVEFARLLPGVTHLYLSVSEDAGPALRLYQRIGFVTWGTEPAALQVEGVSIATHHMVLRLADAAA